MIVICSANSARRASARGLSEQESEKVSYRTGMTMMAVDEFLTNFFNIHA